MRSHSMDDLLSDVISIIKPNGEVIEKVRASVQSNTIFINDTKVPLEENDKIYRKLPSGLVEVFIVLDRGFFAGLHGMLSHYEAKVQREGSIKGEQYKSIVLNLADNSRVNINSTDNSVNTINSSDNVFENIRKELQGIKDEVVKTRALETLKELEAAKNKPSFTNFYMQFIGIVADHITLAPAIIQTLTRFLP